MDITIIQTSSGEIHHCNQEQVENFYPELTSGEAFIVETYSTTTRDIRDSLHSIREVAMALLCDEQSMSKDGRVDYQKTLLDLCEQIENCL